MKEKSVKEFKLENGLKVIIKETHRSSLATFQVWYKVGSGYEPDHMIGASHFLEHMLFSGSKNKKINLLLKKIPEFGGIQNAFTSYDYTTYYETISSEYLDICMQFEADRMHNIIFNMEKFLNEKQIVMEERRLTVENSPYSRANETYLSLAQLIKGYRHPIIGWMHNLTALSMTNLEEWYRTWYVPNNATIVLVGAVDPKKILNTISTYFSNLTPRKLPEQIIVKTHEAMPMGMRVINLNLPAKLPWMAIGYNVPVVLTAEYRWESLGLLLICGILVAGKNSRLYDLLVNKKHLAIDVSYRYSPFSLLDNVLTIISTPLLNIYIQEIQQIILEEFEKLKNISVGKKELERVKTLMLAERVYEEDSLAYQAYELGSFASVGLNCKDIDVTINLLKRITPDQIKQVAKKYLITDRLTIATLNQLPL